MKKLLVLVLLSSSAFAWIPMSDDVVEKSLTLSQEKWTALCAQDARKYYCRGQVCDAYVEMKNKNFCWKYYNTVRNYAFQRKEAKNYTVQYVNKPQNFFPTLQEQRENQQAKEQKAEQEVNAAINRFLSR